MLNRLFTILFFLIVSSGLSAQGYNLPMPLANGSDDYPQLQSAINQAINSGYKEIYLPGHGYYCSHGLVLRDSAGGYLLGVHLYGDGGNYSQIPTITIYNGAAYGINVIGGKGCKIEGIILKGQNSLSRYTVNQVLSNDTSSFVANGCSSSRFAPHAGFVVDGLFYDSANATSVIGGSTGVEFDDCRASFFVVDYCLQPGGAMQANGEIITLTNCWGDYCRSAISVGQAQERSIRINGFYCWGWTKTVFDMVNFGNGTSCPPDVTGLNVAGCVRYLCELNTFINKGLTIRDSHIESLYALGGCSSGTSGILTLDHTWTALQGNSGGCTPPPVIFLGKSLIVNGGDLFQYGAPSLQPLAITALSSSMTDTYLDWIPTNTLHGYDIAFTRCSASGYPFGDDLVANDGAWPSEIAGQNFLWMGKMSIRYSPGIGQITRTRIEDGQPWEWLIPALVVGDLTKGNDTVKNVVIEGNGQFPNPPALYMPEFPPGTTIVLKTATYLVMSAPALVSETYAAILSGNWHGEGTGIPPVPGNYFHTGWKVGDHLINNRLDLYPGVIGWVCTRSGIVGTARPPNFARLTQ